MIFLVSSWLYTGRLSIPVLCTVGQHAAIAHKISFMTATAFAQEAVLDLSAHLADAGRYDIRIAARFPSPRGVVRVLLIGVRHAGGGTLVDSCERPRTTLVISPPGIACA